MQTEKSGLSFVLEQSKCQISISETGIFLVKSKGGHYRENYMFDEREVRNYLKMRCFRMIENLEIKKEMADKLKIELAKRKEIIAEIAEILENSKKS